MTKTIDDFHAIEMIGGFQLVGLLDGDVLVGVTCSCGWQRSEQPERVLLSMARDHNRYSHFAFDRVGNNFIHGEPELWTYARCHDDLVRFGMEEQRAHDYLDSLRAAKLQAGASWCK